MSSKIIRDQLKACSYANLTNYNKETNTFIIPRYTKPCFHIGKCYLIQIPGNILKNPNSILATNWNGGSAPQNEYYKAYVSKTIGKMIFVDCLAFDFNTKQDINIMWSGYLPTDEITQLGEIN